ncbi:MAG: hypothetical protein LLF96_04730, partial [Eubacteriales bacterium]|nr:hypothetical protein [Eubacteriales bacterium]
MKRLAILLLCLLVCLPATGLGEDFLVSDAQETTAETDAGESIVDTLKGELSNAASFTAALAALDTGNLLDAVNAFTKLGSTYGADQYAAYAYALLLRLREEPAEAEEQLQTLSGFLDSDYQLALTRASQLHRFAQDGKYGYVGTDGAWSIAPQFDWAEQVFRLESVPAHDRGNTDYAPQELYMVAKVFVGQTEVGESDVVPLEGAYGLVRSDGVIAVPARYTDVLWAVDGFAAVTDGSACTLYDLVAAAPVGGQYED